MARVVDLAPLSDPSTYAAGFPHDRFRWLRDNDPVSHHDHPVWETGYWALARHVDVQRVSRDADTFHNAPNPFLEASAAGDETTSGLLISLDGTDHLAMRKLVNRGFTPRRVADLTERIRQRVDVTIDALRDRKAADLVHDLALWLPLHVIADLVGVPEPDRRQVFEWTERTFGFDEAVTPEERMEAAIAMFGYAEAMCVERQTHPRDDLISALLDAEVDGDRLTQMQINLFFMVLQNAGSETTRNLITSGTLALLEHPVQLERLRGDLSLMSTAIEELLRYVTPVMQFTRTAAKDTEVGGQPIRVGDHVLLVYSSANRDERAFNDPDGLDITRSPNDHVAFGAGGPHFCLGASLARLEAKEMFEAILTRFEDLEVDGDPAAFPRVHSSLIDGFAHLPVSWSAIR
jgi:cholest-4-en-3-one 26-monooxygenase